MSERYLITGVQLGLLMFYVSHARGTALLKEIENKQSIGQSSEDVENDVGFFAASEYMESQRESDDGY